MSGQAATTCWLCHTASCARHAPGAHEPFETDLLLVWFRTRTSMSLWSSLPKLRKVRRAEGLLNTPP